MKDNEPMSSKYVWEPITLSEIKEICATQAVRVKATVRPVFNPGSYGLPYDKTYIVGLNNNGEAVALNNTQRIPERLKDDPIYGAPNIEYELLYGHPRIQIFTNTGKPVKPRCD